MHGSDPTWGYAVLEIAFKGCWELHDLNLTLFDLVFVCLEVLFFCI